MTSKEKAKQLVERFEILSDSSLNKEIIKAFEGTEFKGSKFSAMFRFAKNYRAKKCALIYVNGILNELKSWKSSYMGNERIKYYEEVKQEIEKI